MVAQFSSLITLIQQTPRTHQSIDCPLIHKFDSEYDPEEYKQR